MRELHARAVDAVALPLIEIRAADEADDVAALRAAWQALPQCALVMFVSSNAVEHFFDARRVAVVGGEGGVGGSSPSGASVALDASTAARWPAGVLAAAPGPGTDAALAAAGVPGAQRVAPDPAAGRFDSEALWQQLAGRDWRGRRVLVVRGNGGRDWLAQQFEARGAEVRLLTVYRRSAPPLEASGQALLAQALAQPQAHLWLFGSAEAVAALQALAPGADWRAARALAPHARIAAAARRAGFGRVDEVAADAVSVAAWLAAQPAGLAGAGDRPIHSSAP